MAKIRISKKELRKLTNAENIVYSLNMLGFPAEEINDNEVEVEVFPNRPDALSIQGLARALNAFLGKETGIKEYSMQSAKKEEYIKVEKSVTDVRPLTLCAIVNDIPLDEHKLKEIIDLQEKLHNTLGRKRKKCAIGIYPLEKIKFPITYKALPPKEINFKPLGISRIMSAQQILEKHPAGKEYSGLLKNFSKYPIFIDSDNKILSMPPIINSEDVGKIEISTKDVFVECSGWNKRTLEKTLAIIVTTLAEMGGKIHQVRITGNYEQLTPELLKETKKIDLNDVNSILGLKIKEKDLEKLLKKMQYEYSKGKVTIPSWRADILHQIDIIEDIAIAYGYENLEPEMPKIATIGRENKNSIIKSKIMEIFTGLGCLETLSYHFITQNESEVWNAEKTISLENTKTDYKKLRPSLKIPLLRILSQNTHAEYPQHIVEVGNVFNPDNESSTGISEQENIGYACTPGNFTSAKQILDYMFKSLGLSYEIHESENEGLIEGRTGAIFLGSKKIGYIGEVHPRILQKLGIKMPTAVIEISLKEIFDKF